MNPLDKLNITHELVRVIGQLDEFKGRWEALGSLSADRLAALRQIATIESAGSSTRIEGANLLDDEVRKLLSLPGPMSFRSRDEQEVAGYAELMELICRSWSDIPLAENSIFRLHQTLLKHSDKDKHHRGKYKTLPNNAEAFDEGGIGVIFETAAPADTPALTRELLSWASEALRAKEHHPLIVIAVFIVRFLAINPFQEGNGRLARALTTLLLLRAGYAYVPYSSLERGVEDNKDGYFLAYKRAQATLDKDESHLTEWIMFFFTCLLRQQEALERKLKREKTLSPLSLLSAKIMEVAKDHGRVTVREAVLLTEANRNTVKLHLKQLTEKGQLTQHGRGKGTWYEGW